MVRINYKSDFDFLMPFMAQGSSGQSVDLGWPGFDWEMRFWTDRRQGSVVASRRGDVLTNCANDDGRIRIVLNRHGLGVGQLMGECHARLPESLYPDGCRDVFIPFKLNMELVRDAGDMPSLSDAQLVFPMIKGDKGEPGKDAEASQEAVEAALEKFRITEEDIESLFAL
ncbi:MAG: hypothetical protein NC102_00270 [Clostridium sp.]|nr:hypothetical protein [Clostridium sp.]